ncbi:hypothetical protein [Thermocrinis minervae]|uniref:Uncharacterized protein n=1 Tax=Thermocrinis minervae TaxID=381751 RepID=A0A1M6QC30_9AQUI|nr:hypothetical protein [Thermocrinis minervae]SHK17728.1 hypothetical protein SAMN05444391_0174 [Thermocrinis minervae]
MLEELKERDRIHSLFLEVLDDSSKKELFLYLMCYLQLVRRRGNLSISLTDYLSCASGSFKKARANWKDILVELNLLAISDMYGRVYEGKDIYKVSEEDLCFITLKEEYVNRLDELSVKVLKYWMVINKIASGGRKLSILDAALTCVYLFNEELYDELHELLSIYIMRYPSEKSFFNLLDLLIKVNTSKGEKLYIQQALGTLKDFGEVYCGINLKKLKEDLYMMYKGKLKDSIKLEFVKHTQRRGLLRKVIDSIVSFIRKLKGGKKWTLQSSETAFYFFTEDLWKRHNQQRM